MFRKRVHLILALPLGFLGSLVLGEDTPGSAAGTEPKADEVLRRMSKYLAGARQFSFEAQDMVDEMLDTGQKIQVSSTRRIAVRRPDRISADIVGDIVNERVRYDGKKLTVLDNRQKAYGVIEAPDNIDEMLDYAARQFNTTMPLADFAFSNPYEAVIGGVRLGQYIGLHDVRGVKCHHLAFRQDGLDWQIWIEDGDQPLPRKLVITYKASPGQPQYIAFLGKWDLSCQLPDSAFTLEVPEDVKRIDLEPVLRKATGRSVPLRKPTTQSDDGR